MRNSGQASPSSQPAVNDVPEAAHFEDEIDLREYIEVIVKRKKLVLSVFVIIVVASVVISWCLPKVYEASASIMVMPSRIRSALSPTQISLEPGTTGKGEYVEQKPTISIPTHRSLLESSAVLERVITRLKAAGKLDEELALEELAGRLKVEDAGATNVLQLAAQDKQPGRARDIANTWADEYAKYSLEIITGEVKGSGEFVEDQFGKSKKALVEAEHAVEEFDVKERLSLMEIELKENRSQLELHYAKVYKLDFALSDKRNLLQKTDDDIAAMTKDGIWLGAFGVKELGEEHFADESLNPNQRALRQKAIKAKLDLENSNEKRDGFVSDSGIMLLKKEVTRRRAELLNDKSLLSKVRQLSESTKSNLASQGSLDLLKGLQGPIAENLSDLTIWEILSLTKGYNFFETRGRSLASKLEQEEKELKDLEKVLLEHEDQLKTLDENLSRAQANYDFYHGQFKALENQENSTESETATLEVELSYSKGMAKKLEDQVKALKVAINEKKAKLTELNRQLEICKNAYATLSLRIEEARIAKAMELGEVKVVSTAFEPQFPVKPRKKLIVGAAAVASLILSIFAAFFLEFWRKEEVKTD